MIAHVCNPRTWSWEIWLAWSTKDYTVRPCSSPQENTVEKVTQVMPKKKKMLRNISQYVNWVL